MAEPNDDPNPNPEDNTTEDVAGLKSALQAEREARRTEEKTRKDLEKRLKAIEDSGKTEAEKIAARLKELEDDNAAKSRAIQERDAKDAVREAARKAGAPDADLVYRVIRADLEYDEGRAVNVKDLIDDLKATTPHLFKAPAGKADGGSGTSGKPKHDDMNARIRQAAGVT